MKPAEIYGLMMIKGVEAEAVAKLSGCHVDLVYKAIRGERRGPESVKALTTLASALGLAAEELVGEVPHVAA